MRLIPYVLLSLFFSSVNVYANNLGKTPSALIRQCLNDELQSIPCNVAPNQGISTLYIHVHCISGVGYMHHKTKLFRMDIPDGKSSSTLNDVRLCGSMRFEYSHTQVRIYNNTTMYDTNVKINTPESYHYIYIQRHLNSDGLYCWRQLTQLSNGSIWVASCIKPA